MSNIIISVLVCGALFAWIVFCTFSIVQRLYKACSLLYVSTTRATNDNDKAVQHFIDLLNEAKKKMTIYDDGNDMDGSAYKDTEVIDAVRRKLDQNPGFEMQCFFNYDHDLPFRKAFDNHPRVDIRTGGGLGDRDVHYKIIDDGKKAYLSRHDLGDSNRSFKQIDCTEVPERHLKYVTDAILGEYKEDIERKFSSSNTANLNQ